MNKPNLTKTCANCGQQKPLTAFLQMSGTQHGTAYGNICADCRKAVKEQISKRKKTEAEGSTTSETGHRIDSKTKVHDAIDKREKHQKTEEEYHDERKEEDEKKDKKKDKKKKLATKERKHREEYLKKRTGEKPADKKAESKREAAARHGAEIASREERQNEAVAAQAHGAHEDRKRTKIDFSVTYHGQQIAGSIKHTQNVFLRQFADWLGNSAPIVRNVAGTGKVASAKQAGSIASPFAHSGASTPTQRGRGNTKAAAGKPQSGNPQSAKSQSKAPAQTSQTETRSAAKQAAARSGLMSGSRSQEKQNKTESATQYVEKNWRPSGGGGRRK